MYLNIKFFITKVVDKNAIPLNLHTKNYIFWDYWELLLWSKYFMKYINEQNFNYMLLSIYIALDNVVAPDQEAKMKHID